MPIYIIFSYFLFVLIVCISDSIIMSRDLKRHRAKIEKHRRKVEAYIKMQQERRFINNLNEISADFEKIRHRKNQTVTIKGVFGDYDCTQKGREKC